ncbi:MAG: haloacid dehalogenase [Candidatus Leucobacter sulfamidivorax]|nr:haloacid dehalogenase [Candidatus Leucobacter sulfamidivorax]
MAVRSIPAAERHLVALDLDGTVLHRDETFDPEVGGAIRALADVGHEIVIATGRSVDATLPIVERLRIRPEWVVCCNGAVTLRRDPLADRAYRHEFVEAFDATEVLTRIRSHLVTALYGLETVDGELLYTEEIPAGTLPARRRLVRFEELLGVQATRLLVVSPDHALEEFLRIVDRLGLTRVSYAIGYTAWLDIAPEGVSKESALEVVRQRLGVDRSRVFAAGDGNNDIQMLRWADRFGDAVAMGQAVDAVKAAAGRVTGRIDEGGLAAALHTRFPDELGPLG